MRRVLFVLALLALLGGGTPGAAHAGLIEAFTEQVSPESETNATEPSVAVDRSDGTLWVCYMDTFGDPYRHQAWPTCTLSRNGGTTWAASCSTC